MADVNPGLFGIVHSNRDFTDKETWGKNQFNSSFPAALSAYLSSKGLPNLYIYLDDKLKIKQGFVSTTELFGIDPKDDDLFFAFESGYSPYQQFVVGNLPRVDLVTQRRSTGNSLRPIEIKLTALPDNSTCLLDEEYFGCELVIRPDTIVYLSCSIVSNFKGDSVAILYELIGREFDSIKDWSDGSEVWAYIPNMISRIDKIIQSIITKQEPLVMQPIFKTRGKSPKLADNCLDVFIWSNFAFIQLFLDVARGELSEEKKVTRQIRTIIWLFKMLYDYSQSGKINHTRIIDELSYNTKNDKAFAASGRVTHHYMTRAELTKPRILKSEIKKIILGGGQNLLSPERRFDAIIYNTPDLFD